MKLLFFKKFFSKFFFQEKHYHHSSCNYLKKINFFRIHQPCLSYQNPTLIIASDLLFKRPYDLSKFFKSSQDNSNSKLYAYKIPESKVHKHGIIEVEKSSKSNDAHFFVKKFFGEGSCDCDRLLPEITIGFWINKK